MSNLDVAQGNVRPGLKVGRSNEFTLRCTTAAIFITFFMAYPATAPNRNPPPAEKRKYSAGNLEAPS
jgi:hypothetical protein